MQTQSSARERGDLVPSTVDAWDSQPADTQKSRDLVFKGFVHALLPPVKAAEVLRGIYTDTLHSALMDRLAELRNEPVVVGRQRKTTPLQTWRLRLVYQFVEAHLDAPIGLKALSKAAGLSPMHFASGFRAATGLRPAVYVTRCRIQRAKSLLTNPDTSIVEAALSVGYQNQAHFTTVFRRVTGTTPHRWRELQRQRPERNQPGAEEDQITLTRPQASPGLPGRGQQRWAAAG